MGKDFDFKDPNFLRSTLKKIPIFVNNCSSKFITPQV